MIDVPVSAVMTEAVPTVPPDTIAAEAAGHLRRADVHAVVVATGDGVEGIVTESDVVAVVAEGGGNPTVESFMSSPVVTVNVYSPGGRPAVSKVAKSTKDSSSGSRSTRRSRRNRDAASLVNVVRTRRVPAASPSLRTSPCNRRSAPRATDTSDSTI